MNKMSAASKLIALAVFSLALGTSARAQNDHSWVTVGSSDANPCTYAVPCGTFAGAIAKTNPGGTISAKVSGDYGKVTINKSIIIDGAGVGAFINATTGNAIAVNTANFSDVVILRNLTLNGLGTATRGIDHRKGLLIVDRLRIASFDQGYLAKGSSSVNPLRSEISYTNFDGNRIGALIQNHTGVALSNCVITGTINKGGVTLGVTVEPEASTSANVKIEFCEISHAQSGVRTTGSGTSDIWIRSNHLFKNDIAFNLSASLTNVHTDGLNHMSNNGADVPTTPGGGTFTIVKY